MPAKRKKEVKCPVCSSDEIYHLVDYDRELPVEKDADKKECSDHVERGYCLCPECGMKISHQAGIPCRRVICPECKINMIRDKK
jgi:hypothetical protein